MSESLLVGSKTRAALKANGVHVGAGALDALNAVVHWHIDQAAKRAAANRRKTVRAHDFIVIEAEADRPAGELPDEVLEKIAGGNQIDHHWQAPDDGHY